MNQKYLRPAIVSAILAVVAILFIISVTSSDTNPTKVVASNVEKVTPAPGAQLGPQGEVSIDLQDGYIGRLFIDGQIIPEDQLETVIALGQYTFRPGPDKAFEQFTAGIHSAELFSWVADEPEPATPASYKWDFKVTS